MEGKRTTKIGNFKFIPVSGVTLLYIPLGPFLPKRIYPSRQKLLLASLELTLHRKLLIGVSANFVESQLNNKVQKNNKNRILHIDLFVNNISINLSIR